MKKEKILEGIYSPDFRLGGMIYERPYGKNQGCYYIDKQQVSNYELKSGARLEFVEQGKKCKKIFKICGVEPLKYQNRKRKEKLTVINPEERIDMSSSKFTSLRILDMFVPIGFGTRGLIISPPRAGKTVLLEELAVELCTRPEIDKLIVLLIDERPEEVTAFIRNTDALIYHSDLDSDTVTHVKLAELMLENIKMELECGNNIVVLIDSLTRLSRASNRYDRRSGQRIMSGGIGTGAMQLARKLLGQARKIENGGSCTILATILRETGSRMDEIIFQEFKGTGNSEIVLDSELSYERIFPALDIGLSGTRRDELLLRNMDLNTINLLRRQLISIPKVQAITELIGRIENTCNNQELLEKLK